MASVKIAYGTRAAITCTVDSLAAAAARQSLVIDNTSNDYLDYLVSAIITTATGTIANDKGVTIFAYALVDATHYTDNASGSDATFTLVTPPNLHYVGFVSTPTTSGTFYSGPFSIAQAFGGVVPEKWGLVVYNNTGVALSTGNSLSQIGVYETVA